MTLLHGAHGSCLLHIAALSGGALCGCDTTHPVVTLDAKDLLCWGCADLVAGVNPVDYPFCWIEDQIAELFTRIPYDAYLKTRHWAWLREVALDHYGRSCALCGTHAKIQVHHRSYDRLGRELLSDLTLLCDECHARYHGKTAA